ncbi:MAG TPA: hypothetical protein VLS27_13800, partial [Gammaproteobacteria bacterium]|nr:hypothetical protein [Gammaproteobacteria bacterium]
MAALRLPVHSTPMSRLARLLAGSSLLFFICAGAPAIEEIVFSSGPVRGPGWSVARTQTRLRVDDARPSAVIELDGIKLPGYFKPIDKVSARCDRLRFQASGIVCAGGELRVQTPDGAPAFSPARFEAAYGNRGLRFTISGLELGGGVVEAAFEGTNAGFSLHATGESLPLPALLGLIDLKPAGIEGASESGVVSGKLRWRDSSSEGELSASLNLEQLAFSDASGLNAGENLVADLGIEASHRSGPWRFRSVATVSAGQVYLHPVFVDASEGALELEANGNSDRASKSIAVEEFSFRHHGVGQIDGSAVLGFEAGAPRMDRLVLETGQLALARFHPVYIKPWLTESAFSKLTASGNASARIAWSREGSSEAALTLRELNLDDDAARFGLLGLSGEVHWRESGTPRQTRIGFKGARFYRIDLGPTELVGVFLGSDFRLSAPLDLPMLGGALHIDDLEATGLGGERLSWRMRGALRPISIMALTSSLEWPPFSGSLSGEVPSLRYADGEINVDGKLNVRAFDGRVQIDGLRLQQPFGVVPRLTADVVVDALSLGALTSTFSFGNIEGRLSGRIDDLVLENWRPAAFDARFATPGDDKSRHRISQRAVENLARIGGAGQVLSSTLLGFLESFSYDRLGISCRLKNGVCEMGGIEDARRGYYIVKGGGLPPRIDVYGFNT